MMSETQKPAWSIRASGNGFTEGISLGLLGSIRTPKNPLYRRFSLGVGTQLKLNRSQRRQRCRIQALVTQSVKSVYQSLLMAF
jgi:hypothetical protein